MGNNNSKQQSEKLLIQNTKIKLNSAVFDVILNIFFSQLECPISISDLIKDYADCHTLIRDYNFEAIALDIRYIIDNAKLIHKSNKPSMTPREMLMKTTHFIWDKYLLWTVFSRSKGVNISCEQFKTTLQEFVKNDMRPRTERAMHLSVNFMGVLDTMFSMISAHNEQSFYKKIGRRDGLAFLEKAMVENTFLKLMPAVNAANEPCWFQFINIGSEIVQYAIKYNNKKLNDEMLKILLSNYLHQIGFNFEDSSKSTPPTETTETLYILSATNIWRECEVSQILDNGAKWKIHYKGFHPKYDEIVDCNSDRLTRQKPENVKAKDETKENLKMIFTPSINAVFQNHRFSKNEYCQFDFEKRLMQSKILNVSQKQVLYQLISSSKLFDLIKIGIYKDSKFKDDFMTLLYRASNDGYNASQFHAKCDSSSNTRLRFRNNFFVWIIENENGYIFGGVTSINYFTSPTMKKHREDTYAFLYGLQRGDAGDANCSALVYIVRDATKSVTHLKKHSFNFGDATIYIDRTGKNGHCTMNKNVYNCNEQGLLALTGSYDFKIKDFELFSITVETKDDYGSVYDKGKGFTFDNGGAYS